MRKVRVITPSVCFVMLLIVIAAFIGVSSTVTTSTPISGREYQTIIVDPGHGGVDGGCVGIDGMLEKEVNLEISLKLRDMLDIIGYNVIMTREEDLSIHSDSAKTIREKKNSDLNNRLKIIESNPNAIFLSIHQNSFASSRYGGAHVFYSKNNPESQLIAKSIQDQVKSLLQTDNSREQKAISKNSSFLLDNAKTPAVLVECGFLSNRRDYDLLSTPEYRDKMAFSIMCGILSYTP